MNQFPTHLLNKHPRGFNNPIYTIRLYPFKKDGRSIALNVSPVDKKGCRYEQDHSLSDGSLSLIPPLLRGVKLQKNTRKTSRLYSNLGFKELLSY